MLKTQRNASSACEPITLPSNPAHSLFHPRPESRNDMREILSGKPCSDLDAIAGHHPRTRQCFLAGTCACAASVQRYSGTRPTSAQFAAAPSSHSFRSRFPPTNCLHAANRSSPPGTGTGTFGSQPKQVETSVTTVSALGSGFSRRCGSVGFDV
jgi:hypothetical protein